jgi:predicted amino acid racemase/arginase family enzyme
MAGPAVTIDLETIEKNARAVCSLCSENGISVSAVTKVTCGSPRVARALLRGGAAGIGESRIENCHRLRASGIIAPLLLLRIPPLSEAAEIVSSVDLSLNSELPVIRALNLEAEKQGRIHDIILMIDLGDLREGVLPADLLPAAEEIIDMPAIRLRGIGTNLTCYGGVIPTRSNLQELVDYAHRIEDAFDYHVDTISGGNSSSLPLLLSGEMPKEINHLRIGEAILLGRETVERTPWPGTSQRAFHISAEIIELKKKPSLPIGRTGQDAFGNRPVFEDRGTMLRAILNIGREDVDIDGLSPSDERISILGASSDHLLADVTAIAESTALGGEISFLPSYSSLLAAMTSSYVEKRYLNAPDTPADRKTIFCPGSGSLRDAIAEAALEIGYLEVEAASTDKPEVKELTEMIAEAAGSGAAVVVCGRESLTLPLVQALAKSCGTVGLLSLSPLPGLDGPLGFLVGEHSISPENLVLACIESAEKQEAELIRRLSIPVYTMEEVDMLGIREVMRLALRKAAAGTRGLIVRLDPRLADGGRNGLTDRETHLALEMIARSDLLRGFDISGYAPKGSRSVSRLSRFTASVLGKHILG